MTAGAVVVLALCIYGLRATGFFVGDRLVRGRAREMIGFLPIAIISGVLALATFSSAGELALDARAPGMLVAGVAVWQKAPLAVVIGLAAAATALTRALA